MNICEISVFIEARGQIHSPKIDAGRSSMRACIRFREWLAEHSLRPPHTAYPRLSQRARMQAKVIETPERPTKDIAMRMHRDVPRVHVEIQSMRSDARTSMLHRTC